MRRIVTPVAVPEIATKPDLVLKNFKSKRVPSFHAAWASDSLPRPLPNDHLCTTKLATQLLFLAPAAIAVLGFWRWWSSTIHFLHLSTSVFVQTERRVLIGMQNGAEFNRWDVGKTGWALQLLCHEYL